MVVIITRLDWRGRRNFLSKRSISRSALARWPGCWTNSSSWMAMLIIMIIKIMIKINKSIKIMIKINKIMIIMVN